MWVLYSTYIKLRYIEMYDYSILDILFQQRYFSQSILSCHLLTFVAMIVIIYDITF